MRPMPELLTAAHRHRQAIFTLAVVILIVSLLWLARGALPAFFIGLALAFVLDPVVTVLARTGVPRWLGVLVAYAAVVVVVWALVAYALPPISQQASRFIEELPALGAALGDVERGIVDW